MIDAPQTLKGFRDFLPAEKRKRDWVAGKLREAFLRFGFEPVETPTLEYASLLLGKYGDEADKLVYTFEDRGGRAVGLRYDQTVPTARLLGQHHHELPRYFRRYQMQNVFRADKPQKGRYREFAQCDCDIFGSDSPLADAEILAVYYHAFATIGFTTLKIELNDRPSLIALIQPHATNTVSVASIIQSVDKLDKQTPTEVIDELVAKGLPKQAAEAILESLEKAEQSTHLAEIVHLTTQLGVPKSALVYNPKLARGLDYYTGLIFEGKIEEYGVGSVGGGGRYNNLLGELTGTSIPAVGFGIGFDRTVEAADALGLIPVDSHNTQVMVTIFPDDASQAASLSLTTQLRQAGISTELYPAADKLAKQLKMADQKKVTWVAIIGEDELAKDVVTLKHLNSGETHQVPTNTVAPFITTTTAHASSA
jgi:histidyl-tRNA synthetase